MPLPLFTPRSFASDVGELVRNRERADRWHAAGRPAPRRVLGWPLPPWQRPPVWRVDQSRRFIESAWLGLHLGTIVVNGMREQPDGKPHPLSGLLLDGQQRLLAIEAYLAGAFTVFGHDWHELGAHEHRRFYAAALTRCEVSLWQEDALRDLYDRLNFGGTLHDPEERAMPNS